MESNDSPEIPDRGETSDIPGLPSGDNISKWTGLEFGKSQRAKENSEKWKKTSCKIICGAPTILVVKGLMMMMMMKMMQLNIHQANSNYMQENYI